MIYNVDYHFHGNFPKLKKGAYKKAQGLWQKLKHAGINVVISTEHAYKDYKRAYEILQETKPQDIYLFPGIEYLTKEGIDIVIFSETDKIYTYSELAPYVMTFAETIDFVKSHVELRSFVTHPYTPGTTSVIKKLGHDVYCQALEDLGAVEIANSSLDTTINLLNKIPFLNKKVVEFNRVKSLPIIDYPKDIKFLAVGSDSHHCQDIGTHLVVESESNNVFEIITNHNSREVVYKETTKWWYLIPSAITTINEFLIKKFKY